MKLSDMWVDIGLASFFANKRAFAKERDAGADAAKTRLIYVALHTLVAACQNPEYMKKSPAEILELSRTIGFLSDGQNSIPPNADHEAQSDSKKRTCDAPSNAVIRYCSAYSSKRDPESEQMERRT